MAEPSRIKGPVIFEDEVTFTNTINLKSGCVENEHVGANAASPFDAEKLEKEWDVHHSTDVDSAVTAFDLVKHICKAAGEVVALEWSIVTPPTGDYEIDIDVQLWNGSSWSTILDSSPETIDNTATANTPTVVALNGTPTFVDGNQLRFIVTVSGSSGTQGQGLAIDLLCREKP